MLKTTQNIWDPICGYIELNEFEQKIVDSDPLQRLRRINPTPGSSFVFPGLTGNRFSHSLGVMHIAGRMMERLRARKSVTVEEDDIQTVRLSGLLHDIGHGPFSHTFDQFLKESEIDLNHEKIGYYILNNDKQLSRYLNDEDLRNMISYIAWGPHVLRSVGVDESTLNSLDENEKATLFSDVIHGAPHCADILDFLMRDSRNAGVTYGAIEIERIIFSLDAFEGRLGVEEKAFQAYQDLILARYYMFKTVYWHKTSRATKFLLLETLRIVDRLLRDQKERGIREIVLDLEERGNVADYLNLDDYFVFTKLREIFSEAKASGKSKEIATRVFLRMPPVQVFASPEITLDEKLRSLGIQKKDLIVLWRKKIAEKASAERLPISEEDIVIDIPSLAIIPIHARAENPENLKKYLFKMRGDSKEPMDLKYSVVEKLDPKQDEVRIYTFHEDWQKLQRICEELFSSKEFAALGTQA